MISSALNPRAQQLLKTLVESYIHDGQPVGSRTLARTSKLELSPATVRNVMSDLEELGYIHAPHTSAGRIPTVQGYRLFVDSLLTVKKIRQNELLTLEAHIQGTGDADRALTQASSLLSEFTAMAGVISLPKRESRALRQIEFLPLSNQRVLAILIFNEKEVQNRVLQTERDYSESELQEAANYLNATFAGKELSEVRRSLLKEMESDKENLDRLMSTALAIASQALADEEPEDNEDILVAGQTNLMTYSEMADMEKLRQLFEAFGQKRDILHLLDRCMSADGIQIYIGEESGHEVLDGCSVVTAPYKVEDEVVGVLGVIGPTRMAYDRVIPIVDVTAQILSAALKPQQ